MAGDSINTENLSTMKIRGRTSLPPLSTTGNAVIYFDKTEGKLFLSENGEEYREIGGGSGAIGDVTLLPEITQISDDDLLLVVDDPGGTPVASKAEFQTLKNSLGGTWEITEQLKIKGSVVVGQSADEVPNALAGANGVGFYSYVVREGENDPAGFYAGGSFMYGEITGNQTANLVSHFAYMITDGEGDVAGAIFGSLNQAFAGHVGSLGNVYANNTFSANFAATQINGIYSLQSFSESDTGNVNDVFGVNHQTGVYGGEVANNYGVMIRTPDVSGGVLVDNYAFYAEEQVGPSGQNFAIWTHGATPNFFGGNVGIGSSQFGTDANRVLAIKTGTPPSTSPADTIQIYAEDVAGGGEARVMDEAGNVTTFSPHNFSLFAPDASHEFPWAYYSQNRFLGLEINVDMFGAFRELERLSKKKFIHIREIGQKDWHENQTDNHQARERERAVWRRKKQARESEIEDFERLQAESARRTLSHAETLLLRRGKPRPFDEPEPQAYQHKQIPAWIEERISRRAAAVAAESKPEGRASKAWNAVKRTFGFDK